jgi:DNA-binding transcriptional MerR regulator
MSQHDRPSSGEREERLDELEERIEQLEERRSTVARSRSTMSSLVPPDARRHLRAAGREQLLAARSLLDHWIGRLRDEPEKSEKSRENIKID